ncbi:hypothetical protein BKA62DRAFT_698087 [Auriculariales sp. MPI-PUGE-AT-0066]|nr:hypothetical protein BKA62DRAFT_698087 [Auriculariales sp. MPI-PUGE-AT-0066]
MSLESSDISSEPSEALSATTDNDDHEYFESYESLFATLRALAHNPRKWQRVQQHPEDAPLPTALTAINRKFPVPERLIHKPDPFQDATAAVGGVEAPRDQALLLGATTAPRSSIQPPQFKVKIPPMKRGNGTQKRKAEHSDQEPDSDHSDYKPAAHGGIKRITIRYSGGPQPKKPRTSAANGAKVSPSDDSANPVDLGKSEAAYNPFESWESTGRGGYLQICDALENFRDIQYDGAAVSTALAEVNDPAMDRTKRLSNKSTVAFIIAIRHNDAGKVKKCPIPWCSKEPDSAVMRHFLGVHSPLHSHCIAVHKGGQRCQAFISNCRPDTIRRHLMERHGWTEKMLSQHGLGLGTGEHTIRRLFGCAVPGEH